MMYEPNVFPIEIAKMLAGDPVDQAIGVLAITIHSAQGLKNPDKFAGTPDPYTVVSLNSRNPLGKTKTVKQNASPHWNETIHIIITSFTDALTLQVLTSTNSVRIRNWVPQRSRWINWKTVPNTRTCNSKSWRMARLGVSCRLMCFSFQF
jgi:Ca2+-dependent lipid-binding protein